MEYVFDYSKLRGRIREICGTEENWAKLMGFSDYTKSMKLNNKSYFKSNEITKCCKILKIPKEDIGVYFFTEK
ncbi:DUF739 family protein [Thomasclavelia sp.]|uniref:DUF739 family protein n=1 Tax=Thomasclavelia sp. TaxID=3025757 RepID=UPI0025FB6AD5|nr:DUF739 family protein [Thomasclavelia sp.]